MENFNGMNAQYKAMSKAVATELLARQDRDRETTTTAPAKAKGFTDTQLTFIVIGFFTIMATALSYFGLIA